MFKNKDENKGGKKEKKAKKKKKENIDLSLTSCARSSKSAPMLASLRLSSQRESAAAATRRLAARRCRRC